MYKNYNKQLIFTSTNFTLKCFVGDAYDNKNIQLKRRYRDKKECKKFIKILSFTITEKN